MTHFETGGRFLPELLQPLSGPVGQMLLPENADKVAAVPACLLSIATCLGDGEQTRWNRTDFIGVLR